jgi:hypothetical protein
VHKVLGAQGAFLYVDNIRELYKNMLIYNLIKEDVVDEKNALVFFLE